MSGGASVVQQYLEAGLLDELQVNLAPVLLGGGTRLFDSGLAALPALEIIGVVDGSGGHASQVPRDQATLTYA